MNIEDVEDENVNKVIEQFDFERARSIMVLTARDIKVPTIDELKKTAKRLLLLCMEHQDREFWWAGGMHHGGICARVRGSHLDQRVIHVGVFTHAQIGRTEKAQQQNHQGNNAHQYRAADRELAYAHQSTS